MRRKEAEELRRLEEALMESEYEESCPGDDLEFDIPELDELDILEDTWQETADVDYEVYNTDHTDVDLEEYSEEVYRERSSDTLPVLLTIFTAILLGAVVLLLLKYLGVL